MTYIPLQHHKIPIHHNFILLIHFSHLIWSLFPSPFSSSTTNGPTTPNSPNNPPLLITTNEETDTPSSPLFSLSHNTHSPLTYSPSPPLVTVPPQAPTRRSERSTKPPSHLQDFHIEATLPLRNAPSSSTNLVKPLGTIHPLSQFLSYAHLSPTHKAYITQLTPLQEPTSFFQGFHSGVKP